MSNLKIAKGRRKKDSPFANIETAVEAFRAGEMIIVCDDEDRENEGDLTVAGEKVTPEVINFMTDVRFHRGRPIVALDGVQTMNAAEALAGTELRIETGALQPLPARSFYHHDLVGCTVETPQGVNVGVVTGVEGSGTSSRLIVQGRSGEVQMAF